MRPGAPSRVDSSVLERVGVNPFRTRFHWSVGVGAPVLQLASATGGRRAGIPARPTLLTGGVGSGRRTTLDRIVEQAAIAGWRTRRVDAGTDDLDDAAELAPDGGGHTGVLVAVDELHAASRAGCAMVFAAIERAAGSNRAMPVRVVVSATHRSSLATEPRTLEGFDELVLVLDLAGLAAAFGAAAASHGRELGIDAAQALHEASAGVGQVALEHAAVAWDATGGDIITAERVAAIGPQVVAARLAHMRSMYSSRFSLSERRYMRAIASYGTNQARLDDVQCRLRELSRFEISDSMLDAVSTELVRQGVLIVCEGVATIAVPGLAYAL